LIRPQKKLLFNNRLYYLFFLVSYFVIPIYYGIKFYPGLVKFFLSAYLLTILFCYFIHAFNRSKNNNISFEKDKLLEKINILEEEAKKESYRLSVLSDKIGRYSQLQNLMQILMQSLSLERTAKIIIERIYALVANSNGRVVLYLLDTQKQALTVYKSLGAKNYPAKDIGADIFDSWVFKHQMPLLVEDVNGDFRFNIDKNYALRRYLGSLISVPLFVGKRIIGILRAEHSERERFSSEDLRYLRAFSDIAALSIDNARLYQYTQQLAITDGLTGCYLRQYFMVCLNEEIKQSGKEEAVFSLIMADVDNFKKYNDKFGHIAGDILLTEIAACLRRCSPKGKSIISRYGGEEFIILLSGFDKKQARAVAEEIRKSVEKREIVLRRMKNSATMSIGLCSFPEDGLSGEKLLQVVDKRLYRAKSAGRNKVCFS